MSDAHRLELEKMAKARGFSSADQMMAWANQRNQQSGGTISAPPAAPQGGEPLPAEQGFSPGLMMHPAMLFEYLRRMYGNATGQP